MLHTLRTLIVDDERDIRELLTLTLGRMGIRIDTAANLGDGLMSVALVLSPKPSPTAIPTARATSTTAAPIFISRERRFSAARGSTIGLRRLSATGPSHLFRSSSGVRTDHIVATRMRRYGWITVRRRSQGYANLPEKRHKA